MKRSEALKQLEEILQEANGHLAEEINAEWLLGRIEQMGMQPPSHMKPIPFENGIQYPLVPGDMKNDNGIWCTPGYFGWEPEQ